VTIKFERIAPLREQLDAHPVYGALNNLADLRVFMSHHVFSVWDFMSLIKYLQGKLAPTTYPWAPGSDPVSVRFINELVLEEESDQNAPGQDGPDFLSHFELYQKAMIEIGADITPNDTFVETATARGIEAALATAMIPAPSAQFTAQTFSFIAQDKPHVVAAALAYGRENIIPSMFRSFLADMHITANDAPVFHYYLQRHIHLDEDFHGPLSKRMVDVLCQGDVNKVREAEDAAIAAIKARITFWDDVHIALG